MIDIIISLILYTLFGLIGIFLFKRINFTKNIFNKKQSAIYLSIYYIVFGFFLGQLEDGNPDIRYQISFGLGHYFICFVGTVIATFLGMGFKFSFNKELFYYALHGSIICGSILFIFAV